MPNVLLTLGGHKFTMSKGAYDRFNRKWQFNWADTDLIGSRASGQYMGQGAQTITLDGTVYPPDYGEMDIAEQLAKLGVGGKHHQLVVGDGYVLGLWRIDSVNETGTYHMDNGLARKVEFSLTITYVSGGKWEG